MTTGEATEEDQCIQPEMLQATFPALFEQFPQLDMETIFEALDSCEFDEESATKALLKRCKPSSVNKRSKVTPADEESTCDQSSKKVKLEESGSRAALDDHATDDNKADEEAAVVIGNRSRRARASSSKVVDSDDSDFAKEPRRKPAAPKKLPVCRYDNREDEVEECEEMVLFGEEQSDDEDDEDAMNAILGDVPCRILDDFTVFDISRNNQLVPLEHIDFDDTELRIAGSASPKLAPREQDEFDEDLDEDEDEENAERTPSQNIRTTTIFKFEITWRDNGKSEIWALTQYAWYWLRTPSEKYSAFFEPLFKRGRLSNMVIAAVTNSKSATLDEIVNLLNDGNSGSAASSSSSSVSAIGSSASCSSSALKSDYDRQPTFKFSIDDIRENMDCICSELELWAEECGCNLGELTLWKDLQQFQKKGRKGKGRTQQGPRRKATMNLDSDRQKVSRNINKLVLTERNLSTVTPWISKLSKNLFRATQRVAGQPVDMLDENDVVVTPPENKYKEETKQVEWNSDALNYSGDYIYYEKMLVDGESVQVGDCVLIRNDDPQNPWFARIMFLCEEVDSGDKIAHVRYFENGSQTLLNELANPRELFLVDSCENVFCEAIIEKCEVRYLPRGAKEPPLRECIEHNYYFYRYFWFAEEKITFEDAMLQEKDHSDGSMWKHCDSLTRCEVCEGKAEVSFRNTPKRITDENGKLLGVSLGGVDYHPLDFVYIIENEDQNVYGIGQIIEIKPAQNNNAEGGSAVASSKRNDFSNKSDHSKGTKSSGLVGHHPDIPVRGWNGSFRVRMFYRWDQFLVNNTDPRLALQYGFARDARQLYMTDEHRNLRVKDFEGKCWVQHRDEVTDLDGFRDMDDTFHFHLKRASKNAGEFERCESVPLCPMCRQARLDMFSDMQEFLRTETPLSALDIFSGCGGLTVGLERCCMVKTKYSVEFSPSAAYTFKKNFPDATVFNQCASLLLERAINIHWDRRQLEPIQDFQANVMPELPAPGAVDFIYGGPPCQGFSGINRFKRADDIKNSLVTTMLSYVDFYQPRYFLLENVRGMLQFKLGGTQMGTRIEGGIKMGVIKYLLRALTSMDYQCSITIQQAGHHGVPQSRRRIFISGVKRGNPLNDWPVASHNFPKQGSLTVQVDYPDRQCRYAFHKNTNGLAAHPAATVWDATSDLGKFEFVNPHDVYKATEEEIKEAEERARTIEQYTVKNGSQSFVGKKEQEYDSPVPLSEFQRRVRRGTGATVHDHVTRTYIPITVERICKVPMRAGADHSDLPEKLRPWCLSAPESAASRHNGWKGLYGRLDMDGQFLTALTDIQPMGKQGTVIHPTQKRVVSVRECARAQGFPDKFRFYSTNNDIKDMYRQVGNAVPPPLAEAIGKKIVQAWFEEWKKVRHLTRTRDKGKGKMRAPDQRASSVDVEVTTTTSNE